MWRSFFTITKFAGRGHSPGVKTGWVNPSPRQFFARLSFLIHPRRYSLVSFGVVMRLAPEQYRGSRRTVHFLVHRYVRRIDVTDLSWFGKLLKEQQSFRFGLRRITDRIVVAALEKLLKKKTGPRRGRV